MSAQTWQWARLYQEVIPHDPSDGAARTLAFVSVKTQLLLMAPVPVALTVNVELSLMTEYVK
jgi:hypothetical protein